MAWAEVMLEDCTVDPGGGLDASGIAVRPQGIVIRFAGPAAQAELKLIRCIVGRLDLPVTMSCVHVEDSIVDGRVFLSDGTPAPGAVAMVAGPPAIALRSTIFGRFRCHRLEASGVLFVDAVQADRLNEGCVRLSRYPAGSRVPRAFHCTNDEPIFTSTTLLARRHTRSFVELPQIHPDAGRGMDKRWAFGPGLACAAASNICGCASTTTFPRGWSPP